MSDDIDWTVPKWITTIEAVEMARRTMLDAERERVEHAERESVLHRCLGCEEKQAEIERLTFENERLRSGLRGIRREFGYKSINNGTSTLGGFIDMLLINDVAGAKRLEQGVSDEKRNV